MTNVKSAALLESSDISRRPSVWDLRLIGFPLLSLLAAITLTFLCVTWGGDTLFLSSSDKRDKTHVTFLFGKLYLLIIIANAVTDERWKVRGFEPALDFNLKQTEYWCVWGGLWHVIENLNKYYIRCSGSVAAELVSQQAWQLSSCIKVYLVL